MDISYSGLDPAELRRVLATATDHAGAPVQPFVETGRDWPLRCCLTTSRPGDRLAIIAFSNFPWTSPYRETGPVVVHADGCAGASGEYPRQFDDRDQVVRAFGDDAGRVHTQVYDLNTLVRAGDGLEATVERILADERVEFVHAHNVLHQCYSFSAQRADRTRPAFVPPRLAL